MDARGHEDGHTFILNQAMQHTAASGSHVGMPTQAHMPLTHLNSINRRMHKLHPPSRSPPCQPEGPTGVCMPGVRDVARQAIRAGTAVL
jgi:hypothetical protein